MADEKMTKAEKECASMGPGFRKLVRTLHLKQQREKREEREGFSRRNRALWPNNEGLSEREITVQSSLGTPGRDKP